MAQESQPPRRHNALKASSIMGGGWFLTIFLKALLLDPAHSVVAALGYGLASGAFMFLLTWGIVALANHSAG